MTFSSLGLSKPLLDAVSEQGYDTPTPIQKEAIPAIIEGRDVMAAAQTGTGKTAGFTLPLLEHLSKGERAKPNHIRALVLTPTRELAAQVAESIATYGKHLDLTYTVVFGGVKINPQMMKLRKGVDVLVATPGRLLDLFGQNAVKFSQVEILVLDEADRMLDMGFIHDIRKVLNHLPRQRQNLMFSATFSNDIRKLAKGLVNNPVEISVSPRNTTVESVEQFIIPSDKGAKPALLAKLIIENRWGQVLVFTRTKHGANRLTKHLEKKRIKAAAIHGNKSQGARTRALADFKSDAIQVLVATDIAARGLDIEQLPHVVNFDLPNVPEDYVHRIGRTGRAGATGEAVSLVSADEFKLLADIERLIQNIIPRKIIEGFEPDNDLPKSDLSRRPPRPKSPNKPREGNRGGQGSRGSSQGRSQRNVQGDNEQGGQRAGQSKRRHRSRKPGDSRKPDNSRRSGSSSKPAGNRTEVNGNR